MKEAGYTKESLLLLDDFIKVHANSSNFYIIVTYHSKRYKVGENKKGGTLLCTYLLHKYIILDAGRMSVPVIFKRMSGYVLKNHTTITLRFRTSIKSGHQPYLLAAIVDCGIRS